MKIRIDLTVNGDSYPLEVEPQETLLEVLRGSLHLMGTKEGCGTGDCGVCIVLVDGIPVNSCLMLAVDAHGHQVTTIEGLSKDGVLHPLQRSFVEKGAVQCGFCSPAMILSAKALLDLDPHPSHRRPPSPPRCRGQRRGGRRGTGSVGRLTVSPAAGIRARSPRRSSR